jgi:hypothetical protein
MRPVCWPNPEGGVGPVYVGFCSALCGWGRWEAEVCMCVRACVCVHVCVCVCVCVYVWSIVWAVWGWPTRMGCKVLETSYG